MKRFRLTANTPNCPTTTASLGHPKRHARITRTRCGTTIRCSVSSNASTVWSTEPSTTTASTDDDSRRRKGSNFDYHRTLSTICQHCQPSGCANLNLLLQYTHEQRHHLQRLHQSRHLEPDPLDQQRRSGIPLLRGSVPPYRW